MVVLVVSVVFIGDLGDGIGAVVISGAGSGFSAVGVVGAVNGVGDVDGIVSFSVRNGEVNYDPFLTYEKRKKSITIADLL